MALRGTLTVLLNQLTFLTLVPVGYKLNYLSTSHDELNKPSLYLHAS